MINNDQLLREISFYKESLQEGREYNDWLKKENDRLKKELLSAHLIDNHCRQCCETPRCYYIQCCTSSTCPGNCKGTREHMIDNKKWLKKTISDHVDDKK
jgi:hypothetical protein